MNQIFYFLFTKSIGLYLNFLSFLFPEKAINIAFKLFTNPRKGKLKREKLPEFLQNSKIEKLNHEDSFFYTYVWEGNDIKILLVHGWESNSSRWEYLFPYLKNTGSTIISLDAPAHGLSEGSEFNIPQYSQFIHKIVQKYQPQYLIGHSIGGKTCLYYQYTFQIPFIEKIIILGAPSDFTIILKKYTDLLSLNSRLINGLKNKWSIKYEQKLEEFSAQLFVKEIRTKGLVIHDLEDKTVSIDEGRKIIQSWKKAHFIQTKGFGHSLQDVKVFNEICLFLFA
ncbi:alpha/beta fold hydrolase [Flavobacterium oreochromis]|uniref:Alpha/beta fold hydrolase n=1 Tax=Flavobacterium oreochromis TaxID=2906078 RepID=A0ABW8P9H5_9FLAO|nr:alpha/beta fold hydrolase [Flavobacterium oreochromis]OWP75903.1 alpha/beta hydrolase [Flavobacterium oreochromis]POR23078.1 alpha/beta hydrolase [Flavobacterium columnare]